MTTPDQDPYWANWRMPRTPPLEERARRIAEITMSVTKPHHGVSLGSIMIAAGVAGPTIQVWVYRDAYEDIDEDLVVRQIKDALGEQGPELAAGVTFTTMKVYPYLTEWGVPCTPELEKRVRRIAKITSTVTARHRGIQLGSIKIKPGASGPTIEVCVIRDECADGNEGLAARQAKNALRRQAPELAAGVTFYGDYCK